MNICGPLVIKTTSGPSRFSSPEQGTHRKLAEKGETGQLWDSQGRKIARKCWSDGYPLFLPTILG